MSRPTVNVLPRVPDDRIPPALPTTPTIQILFQAPEPRRSMPRRIGKLIAVALLGAGAALIAARYLESRPSGSAIQLVSLPDYARYQWAGFHRTGERKISREAAVPLRGNWT